MKTIKIAISILALIFLLTSCSKSDDSSVAPKVYPEENFLQGFLNNSGFVNPTSQASSMGFGFQFKPKVNGKINSFVLKLPQVENEVRVTLKKEDVFSAAIYDELINVTTSNTDFVKVITPIQLEKGVNYYLIVKTYNSFYKYSRTSSNQAVISGNIEIIGSDFGVQADGGSGISYFNGLFTSIYDSMCGNISFNFQQTE